MTESPTMGCNYYTMRLLGYTMLHSLLYQNTMTSFLVFWYRLKPVTFSCSMIHHIMKDNVILKHVAPCHVSFDYSIYIILFFPFCPVWAYN